MRLYNQTKSKLSWGMGDLRFDCEPWGPVEIAEELVTAVKDRGIPLDVTPIAPELRAQARIADEQAIANQEPLRLLRKAADDAKAAERSAKEELERVQVELNASRVALRETTERATALTSDLARANADKAAAERLLTEATAQITAAETRAIKAEALLMEANGAKPKSDKQKSARAD